MAAGMGFVAGAASVSSALKLRLIMGGSQIAETSYWNSGNAVVMGSTALSGSQSVIARLHNYSGGSVNWRYGGDTGGYASACVTAGSIKKA